MRMIVFDTETGGINSETDALLAIGALVVEYSLSGFEKLESYNVLVKPNPDLHVEATALAVNRLSLDVLQADGLEESEAVIGFIKLASKYRNKNQFPLPVGWNTHFDKSFLTAAMKRHNIAWPFYFIELDVAHYWKHYNVIENRQHAFGGIREAARELLNEKVEHTALADVELTLRLLSEFTGVPILDIPKEVSSLSSR